MSNIKYVAQAYSFTHKKMNNVFVSKPYLNASDKFLIVDDFLADGKDNLCRKLCGPGVYIGYNPKFGIA